VDNLGLLTEKNLKKGEAPAPPPPTGGSD